MNGLISMCSLCTLLLRDYEELLATTWNYTYCRLEVARDELSFIKLMCPDLLSEETPYGSILVNDHLP